MTTIPLALDTVNRLAFAENIPEDELSIDEMAWIMLMDSVGSGASDTVDTLTPDLVLQGFKHLRAKLSKIDTQQFKPLTESLAATAIVRGVQALKTLGFIFDEEQKHEAPAIINQDLSHLAGQNVYGNNEQERLHSLTFDGFDGLVDAQGFAGSGKTLMLSSIAKNLISRTSGRIFWVTRSKELTSNVERVVGPGIQAITYLELCERLIAPESVWGARYRYQTDSRIVMKRLGIQDTPERSALLTYRLVNSTVKRFCNSYNRQIETYHLPRQVQHSSAVEKAVILEYARALWSMVIWEGRGDDTDIPVEYYHHIKFVQLNTTQATEQLDVDFLLIDEAQELPPSVVSIIHHVLGKSKASASSMVEGAVMIGDSYQSLSTVNQWAKSHTDGSSAPNRAALSDTQRYGKDIADIAVGLLRQRSDNKDIAIGAPARLHSKVTAFDWHRFDIPSLSKEAPIVFLGQDLWSVLDLMYRFDQYGIRYYLPADTKTELQDLVEATVHFIKTGKILHSEFALSTDWENHLNRKNSEIMDRIDQLFKRGFNEVRLGHLFSQSAEEIHRTHVITLIEHFKGLQSDRVAILPVAEQPPNKVQPDAVRDIAINKLYTGVTRARSELILPEGFGV